MKKYGPELVIIIATMHRGYFSQKINKTLIGFQTFPLVIQKSKKLLRLSHTMNFLRILETLRADFNSDLCFFLPHSFQNLKKSKARSATTSKRR